jgi:hypothetical protein
MSTRYNIDITATDKTGQALRHVSDSFAKLASGTPLEKISNGFSALTAKGRAFSDLTRHISSFGDASRGAAGAAEEGAAGAGELAAGLGVVAGGAVVAVAAVGAAAAAATKFEIAYSAAGATAGRFAAVLGIDVEQLQKYELAGRQAGVSAEAMDAALHGLSDTLEAAGAGRNQAALMLMTRLGIQIHRLPNGAIDATRAMDDLARAMQDQTPQARELIANTMGAGGALNFLIQAQNQREAQLDRAQRSGAIRSKQQIDSDVRMQQSVTGLDDSWHRLLNTLSTRLIIPWLQPAIDAVQKLADMIPGGAPSGAAAGGGSAPAGGGGGGARGASRGGGGAVSGKAKDVQAFFMARGWSAAQAAGIAANLQAESGFDPHAVGDHGTALGVAQWHADRQAAFRARYGHSVGMASLAEQLDFVQWELTAGSRRGAGDRLRATANARDAGGVLSRYYEGPRDVHGEMARRGELAENINGQVDVHVHMHGAPPGTVVTARSNTPRVTTGATVAPSMPGVSV